MTESGPPPPPWPLVQEARKLPPERFEGLGAISDLVCGQSDAGRQIQAATGEIGGHRPAALQIREPGIVATERALLAHRVEEGAAVDAPLLERRHDLVLGPSEAVIDQDPEHPVDVLTRRTLHGQRD